ncbi:SPOR domain-containing protein [Acinetobacter larvae]|uniref:Cell division protein n=1 Tax=Acinetobacter larvae TaxID=1789224 RepID=A0A1B2LVP6_9GAMM|nr:SPOR domain-containing protein [Acinetobacter larvae]AOA57006.1 cell division protein [Acinetobacter larvae]
MFGKTQRGVSERSQPTKKAFVPKWLVLLLVILILMTAAVALMLWKPWVPVETRNEVTSQHYQEETNKDYRFYELLPQQQVTPIPEQAVPEAPVQSQPVIVAAPDLSQQTASAVAEEGSDLNKAAYILQVKSFTDPDSADARRAEIILNGLSADVVKSTENGKTWYRVIAGPYETQSAAVMAQQTLQHSGIDSIVVKR